jgi:hypothetical protein
MTTRLSALSSQPVAELRRTIAGYTADAQRQLASLNKTLTDEAQNAEPYYRETVPDFEARRQRFATARDYQERLSDHLLDEMQQAVLRVRARLEGPGSLGLTPAEWQAAGTLMPLAQARVGDAALSVVAAELRAALDAADRPRLAAFVRVAEARLQHLKDAPHERGDRVLWDQDAARQEVGGLIARAKYELRDTTLDVVREASTAMNVARGDLSGVVGRSRASRRPFVTTDGRPKVTWAVAEAS